MSDKAILDDDNNDEELKFTTGQIISSFLSKRLVINEAVFQ